VDIVRRLANWGVVVGMVVSTGCLSAQQTDPDRDLERDVERAAHDVAREAERMAAELTPKVERLTERATRDALSEANVAIDEADREVSREGGRGAGHGWSVRVDSDGGDEMTIDTTVAFGAGGVVDLGVIGGQITVRGWSRSEARIHASSEEGGIRFEHTGGRLLLEADRRGGSDAEFDLTVPYGTKVLMRSNSGDLHSLGVKGEIEARTVSGELDVSEVVGGCNLENISGDIRARDINGSLRVNGVSGDVELQNVTGDVDISTVSGDIALPNAKSRVVRMGSVSGQITFGGPIDPAGRYDFRSHSGDITLRFPADASAALSLETFSGSIDSQFRITISGSGVGSKHGSEHHIDTKLGNGGAQITVETFSGDIRLEHDGMHSSSE
jgi:DUF4097 and DUF4098 domain-containing protein YvlB